MIPYEEFLLFVLGGGVGLRGKILCHIRLDGGSILHRGKRRGIAMREQATAQYVEARSMRTSSLDSEPFSISLENRLRFDYIAGLRRY